MRLALLSATSMFLTGSVAHAGGFYVPEIGARSTAMGGVGITANDASAVVHNPAALITTEGTIVGLGGALVFPNITFFRRPATDPITQQEIFFDGVTNTNALGAVPFLGVSTSALHEDLRLGLAFSVPFGAHLVYPADGAQRHVVTDVSLRTFHVGPAVAYRITESLSFGVTLNYVFGDFALSQRNALQFVTGDPEQAPNPDPQVEGDTRISGKDTFGLSAKAGLLYEHPSRSFSAGISVLTPVTLSLNGEASVTNAAITALEDTDGNVLAPGGSRQDQAQLEIPLPLIVTAGVSLKPTPRLTIAADVSWQRWSTFEELVVDFATEPELLPTPGAVLFDVRLKNAWRDTLSARIGAEYAPFESMPLWIRAGVLYDQSPIPDRSFDLTTPDSDKLGLSAGAAYRVDLGSVALDFELSFVHLLFAERDIAPPTTTVPGSDTVIPGTDRTILNKSAPSFFYGVTRTRIELLYLGVALRL